MLEGYATSQPLRMTDGTKVNDVIFGTPPSSKSRGYSSTRINTRLLPRCSTESHG
jgi:hypothetical protein